MEYSEVRRDRKQQEVKYTRLVSNSHREVTSQVYRSWGWGLTQLGLEARPTVGVGLEVVEGVVEVVVGRPPQCA